MESNIDIISESDSTFNNLIQATLKYYPIGFNISNHMYPGYKALTEMIAIKITQLATGDFPTPCDKLARELQQIFKPSSVGILLEHQFPNYAFSLELQKIDSETVTITYRLHLRISLLVNYYTIFHEESIAHKNISSLPHNFTPLITRTISTHAEIVDSHDIYFKDLKRLTESAFPDYKFVSHNLLFRTKVTNGIPYGFDGDAFGTSFPLYNFLFGSDINRNLHISP